MYRTTLFLAVALAATLAPASVLAHHGTDIDGRDCTTEVPSLTIDDLYIGNGVDTDLYVYQESNSMPGLQRGSQPSATLLLPDVKDCTHPDTLLV